MKQIALASTLMLLVTVLVFSIEAYAIENVALGKPVEVTTNGTNEENPGCTNYLPSDITDGSLYQAGTFCNIEGGCVAYQNEDYNEMMEISVKIYLLQNYLISKIRYNVGDVMRAPTYNADLMVTPLGTTPTNPGTASYSGAWTDQTGSIVASEVEIKLQKTRISYVTDILSIGEIEIYGVPLGDQIPINVALGKAVMVTTNGKNEETPGCTNNAPSDITDGSLSQIGSNCNTQDGVVAYQNVDYNELMEVRVVIDLQAEYIISKIRYNVGDTMRAPTYNADLMITPLGSTGTKPGIVPYFGAWTEHKGIIIDSKLEIILQKTRVSYPTDILAIGEIEVYGIPVLNNLDNYAIKIRKTDTDKDKDIDAKDLSTFQQSFGATEGSANFNPASDFDGNGKIDLVDLEIFTSMFGKDDNSLYISGCKYILQNEAIIGEKLNSLTDHKCYDFLINDPTTIAILSSGYLDLKSEIYEIINGAKSPIDADGDGTPDIGDRRISNQFEDRSGIVHNNFMLRPGHGDSIRRLPTGHYRVVVSYDDDSSLINDTYGVIVLKRSESNGDLIIDFFTALKVLVEDDGGYEDNDYLDIYVQALFPDLYDTGDNWHHSVTTTVVAERQCKALANFYADHVFGHGQPLHLDCEIDNNFPTNAPDYVLIGPGTTIFNNMSNPHYGDLNSALKGDVWVKDEGLVCNGLTRVGDSYNHYGIYLDDNIIIDANWGMDGRLQIAPTRLQNKIVRPD